MVHTSHEQRSVFLLLRIVKWAKIVAISILLGGMMSRASRKSVSTNRNDGGFDGDVAYRSNGQLPDWSYKSGKLGQPYNGRRSSANLNQY